MKTKMIIKNQKGGSAVEFALVLPLLLALFFCIIEGGLALYNQAVITNASREGARNGIVLRNPQPDSDALNIIIRDTVLNYTTTRLISFDGNEAPNHDTLGLTPPIVLTDVNGGGIGAGDSLTVRVEYLYSFLALPNLAALLRGSYSKTVQLNAQTTMRFE